MGSLDQPHDNKNIEESNVQSIDSLPDADLAVRVEETTMIVLNLKSRLAALERDLQKIHDDALEAQNKKTPPPAVI